MTIDRFQNPAEYQLANQLRSGAKDCEIAALALEKSPLVKTPEAKKLLQEAFELSHRLLDLSGQVHGVLG